jgi:hypothetical protein
LNDVAVIVLTAMDLEVPQITSLVLHGLEREHAVLPFYLDGFDWQYYQTEWLSGRVPSRAVFCLLSQMSRLLPLVTQ